MTNPLPVTVCIPARNEAKNLPACLASLGGKFHQVVVVDSQSSDATRGIAAAAGATVLEFRWDGKFPKKRNWALRNHQWETPWVLFLDADERVTPEFVAYEAGLPADCPWLLPMIGTEHNGRVTKLRPGVWKKIIEPDRHFARLIDECGISDFVFHDLKHCAETYMVRQGYHY